MESLWSPHDEQAAAALLDAVEADDPVGALLAIEGATRERAAATRRRLEALAAQVKALHAAAPDLPPATLLAQVLGHDAGLRGDEHDYHHPLNSSLSAALERRRALPITLSIIWVAVARMAGHQAEAVGMPGHFIARIEGQLVDPFGGGRALSHEDCARIVDRFTQGRLPWSERFVMATPTAQIAERAVRNLVNTYGRAEELERLYRNVRLLATLNPCPPHRLMHARLAERLGAGRLALGLYREIAERDAGTREAELAASRIAPLEQQLQLLH